MYIYIYIYIYIHTPPSRNRSEQPKNVHQARGATRRPSRRGARTDVPASPSFSLRSGGSSRSSAAWAVALFTQRRFGSSLAAAAEAVFEQSNNHVYP